MNLEGSYLMVRDSRENASQKKGSMKSDHQKSSQISPRHLAPMVVPLKALFDHQVMTVGYELLHFANIIAALSPVRVSKKQGLPSC